MSTEKKEELLLSDKVSIFVNHVFGGRHHLSKLEDNNGSFVCVPFTPSLSTFDDDILTRIVLTAHRLCLRAEITNNGFRGIKIILSNRRGREGMLHHRHPTINQAIEHDERLWA